MTAIDLTEIAGIPAHMTSARIAALGEAIDAGLEPDAVELLLLAHTARDLGVSETVVQLMIDDAQPFVARVRAFVRVSIQVSSRLDQAVDAQSTRELQSACC